MRLEIDLTGPDGNALAVVGIAKNAIAQVTDTPKREVLVGMPFSAGSYEEVLEVVSEECAEAGITVVYID